jgi:hypothetical protein
LPASNRTNIQPATTATAIVSSRSRCRRADSRPTATSASDLPSKVERPSSVTRRSARELPPLGAPPVSVRLTLLRPIALTPVALVERLPDGPPPIPVGAPGFRPSYPAFSPITLRVAMPLSVTVADRRAVRLRTVVALRD